MHARTPLCTDTDLQAGMSLDQRVHTCAVLHTGTGLHVCERVHPRGPGLLAGLPSARVSPLSPPLSGPCPL